MALYAEPHDLARPPPRWFARWRGDGIIARVQNIQLTRLLLGKHLPVVDVLGVHQPPRFPLVHVDNAAISRLAAEHLLDRSFTPFAFFGRSDTYWSRDARPNSPSRRWPRKQALLMYSRSTKRCTDCMAALPARIAARRPEQLII